jgi:hypothetical protein
VKPKSGGHEWYQKTPLEILPALPVLIAACLMFTFQMNTMNESNRNLSMHLTEKLEDHGKKVDDAVNLMRERMEMMERMSQGEHTHTARKIDDQTQLLMTRMDYQDTRMDQICEMLRR